MPKPKPLLTPTEQQVALFMMWGWDDLAIAKKLYVCEGTVKCHTTSIFKKLGVNRRGKAALPLLALLLSYGYSVDELFHAKLGTNVSQELENFKKELIVIQALKQGKTA